MFQRLIVPLAFRSFLLSIVIAGIVCIFLAPVRLLRGDQTMSATLREVSAGVSWTGTAVASNAVFDPSTCTKVQTCDVFTLKLEMSGDYRKLHPNFALAIRLSWEDLQNDFDLYVSKDGHLIEDSTQGQTNSEELRIDQPPNGIYHIYTHAVAVSASAAYTGQVRIIAAPLNPSRRSSRYEKDPDGKYGPEMFQFAPEIVVGKADGKSDNKNAVRTAIAVDPFGNTYVSSDGSAVALGAPQTTFGNVYVKQDPQWVAALGAARVYVASAENSQLTIRESDDGGRTYRHEGVIAHLTDSAMSSGQGNLATNGAGTLFNVFAGGPRNEIYLAKCIEPCERVITRRIFSGGAGMTIDHPYPVIAVDHAGGLHVAFSDGQKIFLMSSADGGATWKDPAVVNNPDDPETAVAASPWLFAGDSGRVGIAWVVAAGAVYYGFTADAFAPIPTFSYVSLAERQSVSALPSGTSDGFGNASIVYGRSRLLRQTAGERLIFGPYMTASGALKTETGIKRLSFSVRQDFSGSLTYLDEARRLSLQSMRFTTSKQAASKIVLEGRGRLQDATEVSFTLVTPDSSSKDKDISISMSNGYFAAGMLQSQAASTCSVGSVQSCLK